MLTKEEYDAEWKYQVEQSAIIISAFEQHRRVVELGDRFGLNGMERKTINRMAIQAGCSAESLLSTIATGVVPWEDFGK